MKYDHEAIIKAYPDAAVVDDDAGVFKQDGTEITLDQSLVDAARVELNKLNYRTDRTENGSTVYASFGDQLDMLYADMLAGKLDTTGTWATHIKAVKDANPKP
tara:strand:+ start:487 stop:795 length:309 start_codon:yes stop_codon:yes gene_type:complete